MITRMSERSSREILKSLTDSGLVTSDTPKGSIHLRFSVDSAEALFPKLFLST